eukprot:Hpha_TRINITY_DN4315_c0_g1::TRINITY_DN4315_c0_g1_i1::g.50293::m.50293/K18422/MOV10; helicase MOV-10
MRENKKGWQTIQTGRTTLQKFTVVPPEGFVSCAWRNSPDLADKAQGVAFAKKGERVKGTLSGKWFRCEEILPGLPLFLPAKFVRLASDKERDTESAVVPSVVSQLIDDASLLETILEPVLLRAADSSPPVIAVDLEGDNLSHSGRIALLTIALSPSEVYLVDVHVLQSAAFKTLKALLEDTNVVKLMYDCRMDVAALFHQYSVRCSNVLDVQVCATRVLGAAEGLIGMGAALNRLRIFTAADTDAKKQGRALFAPEKGGSFAIWFERPLPSALVDYCAVDVVHLFGAMTALVSLAQHPSCGMSEAAFKEEGIRIAEKRIVHQCSAKRDDKRGGLRDFLLPPVVKAAGPKATKSGPSRTAPSSRPQRVASAKADLQPADPSVLKTKMCHRGEDCPFVDRQTGVVKGCWFAHTKAELRCWHFAKFGWCKKKKKCELKHTAAVLDVNIPVGQEASEGTAAGTDSAEQENARVRRSMLVYASVGQRPDYKELTFLRRRPRHQVPYELHKLIATNRQDAVERPRRLGQQYLASRYKASLFASSTKGAEKQSVLQAAQFDTSAKARRYLEDCLNVEFCQSQSDVRRYDIPECELKPEEHRNETYYRIDCEGLSEKRPSVLRGDTVVVRDNQLNAEGEHDYHRGFVHWVNLDHVLVHLDYKGLFQWSETSTYHVVFTINEGYFHTQFNAIAKAPTPFAWDDPVLQVPCQSDEAAEHAKTHVTRQLLQYTERLNQMQLEAAVRIAGHKHSRGSLGLFLLHGPPGTGKTTTLVSAVRAYIRLAGAGNGRVLFVAPSNMAANLICERLVEQNGNLGASIVRVCGQGYCAEKECAKAIIPYTDGYKQNIVSKEFVESKQIVVTTIATVGLLWILGVDQDHFEHVIIDEAGQATESETLVPLQFASRRRGTHVTLAGDHKQLGAVLRSLVVVGYDYQRSLLERLLSSAKVMKHLSLQLIDNYRSHPSILHLYNAMTYHNTLRANDGPEQHSLLHLFLNQKPVMFLHVEGSEDREEDSPSWFNADEVQVVMLTIEYVVRNSGIPLEDIVVLSPYQKQCQKIRGSIHMKCMQAVPGSVFYVPDYHRRKKVPIQVCSVEAFQGRESKVIIMTCVRSKKIDELGNDTTQNIGFLKQPQRLNVAISRAKAALFIVGNVGVLQTDLDNWGQLISLLMEENLVYWGETFTNMYREIVHVLGHQYASAYGALRKSVWDAPPAWTGNANPIDTEWSRNH